MLSFNGLSVTFSSSLMLLFTIFSVSPSSSLIFFVPNLSLISSLLFSFFVDDEFNDLFNSIESSYDFIGEGLHKAEIIQPIKNTPAFNKDNSYKLWLFNIRPSKAGCHTRM